MLKLKGVCRRQNLCVDCDDNECVFAGHIEADCPEYDCKHFGACDKCWFVHRYIADMRKKVEE